MNTDFNAFLQQHRLPADYAENLNRYFTPLAAALARRAGQQSTPLKVLINGSQGSGKTTLGDALVMLLARQHQLSAVAISIDDFYLTRHERETLARDIHPLLLTRGVPGTHDLRLAEDTLRKLAEANTNVAIPRFDKAKDDRMTQAEWPVIDAPVDIIILEGWCVNAQAQAMQDLIEPINELEAQEDSEGNWRHYVNTQLQLDYRDLFQSFDCSIMLKAPSFDCVFRWRQEQEEKLKAKNHHQGSGLMSDAEIARFIQHYQRITEHNLAILPQQVDYLFSLDEEREIISTQGLES
ncbi:MAG: hypothetical protein CL693_04735 [Cellvibrionaceae bacterium]|nr:hypothetical protein [Cellvibrionaceae bacterium]